MNVDSDASGDSHEIGGLAGPSSSPPWGEMEEGEQTTTVSSVEVGNEEDQQEELEVVGRRRGGGVGI